MEKTINMEFLANEIIKFLKKKNLWKDTALYFNDKRISTSSGLTEGVNVKDYIEFSNPETITMSFEGQLNHELNGYCGSFDIYNQFSELLEKHGYYFEFGYAWSLTLYEI